MIRHSFAVLLAATTLALTACDNPATGKVAASVTAAGAESAPIKGGTTYDLDKTATKIEWKGSKVTGSHNGEFKTFTGSIQLPADNKPEGARVEIEIDVASVTSDAEKLTGHLKSEDFFAVDKFPKAKFVSSEIKPGGANGATHTITGNFEIRGVKKSISFPAKITVAGDVVTATSEFSINRQDFGVKYEGKKDDLIRDEVVLTLNLKANKKKG